MKLKTKLKRNLRKQTTGLKLARNWLILLSLILGGAYYDKLPVPPIVSPIAEAREFTTGDNEVLENEIWYQKSEFTEEDLKKAVKIFGSKSSLALAVAKAENHPAKKKWWEAVNCWGSNFNEGEYSVGAFQINLAKQCGKGKKVHWDKVPGETLEEKTEWLKNPYNNAVIAKKIYDTSGFNPWTAFTNNSYQKYY